MFDRVRTPWSVLIAFAWLFVLDPSHAGDLRVQWTAPATCNDGTAISNCPVTGYAIWSTPCTAAAPAVGPLTGNPTQTGIAATATSFDFANTPAGTTWCLTAAATSAHGNSLQSNVVVATATAPPGAPAVEAGASLKTTGTDVFIATQVPDGWAFTKVGSVPVGTPCDPTQGVNAYNVVPQKGVTVTWLTAVQPLAILAPCQ